MYAIEVHDCFEAEHYLRLPDGGAEDQHGHQWEVVAEVATGELDVMGTVMDFHELRRMLQDVLFALHETDLNETGYFSEENPSAENVAKYIYERLEKKLPERVQLSYIRVLEEKGCWAIFRK